MSDTSQGPGWWQASDGKWYPPDQQPGVAPPLSPAPGVATGAPGVSGPIGRPRTVGLTILLAFVTFGIWPILWSYWNGEELKLFRRTGVGGVVYVLLMIFISPVVLFLMANEVENMYRNNHEEPPITTLWGLWVLLPLIGSIIWYVRIQHAINDFWIARGAAPPTGPL